jgi:hypothetical protein
MVETAEVVLKQAISARSGLREAELGEDTGLTSAGVDAEDLRDAFNEACAALGIDRGAIRSDAVARPNPWLMTSLRHLGPFWPAADLAWRDLAATVRQPAEPTIRSLAATIRQGRVVPAGPGVPVPPGPPLSSGRVALRAASVGVLTLVAAPAFGFLTCKPICHVCPGSVSEATMGAFSTGFAVLVVIGASLLLPGLLHLRQQAGMAVAQ